MYDQPTSGNFKTPESVKGQTESVKGQTESERILMALDYKLDTLNKIFSTMVIKVTALGGFELLKQEATDAKKPAEGGNFIGELDIRIDGAQRLIEGYSAILQNLERLA